MLVKRLLFVFLLICMPAVMCQAKPHIGNIGHTLGHIEAGVYSYKIADTTTPVKISVIVPQYKASKYFSTLWVTENKTQEWSSVSFGQAKDNYSYYTIVMKDVAANTLTPEIANQALQKVINDSKSYYGKDIFAMQQVETTIGKYKGYYAAYSQKYTPPKKSHLPYIAIFRPQTYTNAFFITQIDDYIVLFWFQGTDLKDHHTQAVITPEVAKIIRNVEYQPFYDFVNSFTISSELQALPA